jgi:hypothetical protein
MLAIIITLLATAYLFTATFFWGTRKPGYSQIRHAISELGEIDSPHQQIISIGVFFPVGSMLLLVAFLIYPLGKNIAALSFCLAVGYLIAAFFPCDKGFPFSGTKRQMIHNLGGIVEYIGGGLALFQISEHSGKPFEIASFVVFAIAFGILLRPLAPVRGFIQRIAEVFLLGGLVIAIWLRLN